MPQGASRWRCHDQGTYVEAHADRGPVLHTEWDGLTVAHELRM